MRNLTLTEIWIYPVKSLGGIRVKASQVLEKGLAYDRRWMLVDENNCFMTQRTFPVLALFKTSMEPEGFRIVHQGAELFLPHQTSNGGDAVQTMVWNDTVETIEPNPAYSEWFTAELGMKIRLVRFPEENARPVDPDYRVDNEHVSLADGFPLLIVGESSLDDLNKRLAAPLPMNRFRPNLVFSGGDPYEEDNWRNFTIGTSRFVGVKPCARCVMTTVDQDKGLKGIEPLATLATYRKRNGEVYFGQNVIALDQHSIYEGDRIVL